MDNNRNASSDIEATKLVLRYNCILMQKNEAALTFHLGTIEVVYYRSPNISFRHLRLFTTNILQVDTPS